MSYLNANIPPIYCKIKKEYLYDLKKHHGESEDCVIFAITSISGRAILFNIMLPNGACFWRLPISAFFQKSYDRSKVPDMHVHELELWNCFSYWPSITCFDWLEGLKGKFLGLDKKFYQDFNNKIKNPLQLRLAEGHCISHAGRGSEEW